MSNDTKTHQTWGLLRWSRFQGTRKFFGSDFKHMSGVTVKLNEASLRRELSRTWYYAEKPIASVRMTESQFAEFLTTPNSGNGVPCTIEYRPLGPFEDMGPVKEIPSEYDMHKEEGRETIRESLASADKLAEMIADLKVSKKVKEELLWQVELINRALGSSLDHVENSFNKRMAEIVQKAKTDIEAFTYHAMVTSGMAQKKIGDSEK